MSLNPGTRLGSYEIIGPLGAGGMGEVYRARDARLQRDVAIKVLPDHFANDAERLARFEREAHVLASLHHANIAVLYGVEDHAAGRALIMELVEGPTLAELIAAAKSRAGGLPIADGLAIARQIASALESAHEHGLIHRDLKPANVKVTADGTVKVLDFGLAKVVMHDRSDPGRSLANSPTVTSGGTRLGVILGTAAYMSPEQARGKLVDKRTDIWAFGCVLYEMLAGRPVFDGDDASDVLARVLEREPDFSALPAATPSAVRRLLRRALEKDRHQRLADLGDARLELDEAVKPSHESTPALALQPARRGGWIWGAIVGLVIGTLATAGLYWMLSRSAPPPPIHLSLTPPRPATLYTDPTGSSIALSADGRYVVYAGVSGTLQLYARRVDEIESRPIPGTEGARQPFFAPDGKSVGFWSAATGEIKRVAFEGGLVSTVCQMPTGIFFGASWGVSDVIVFAAGGLYRVAAGGGKPEVLTTPQPTEFEHRWPEFLPDGRTVLFTIWRGNPARSHLGVQSLSGGASKILLEAATAPRYTGDGRILFYQNGALRGATFDTARQVIGDSRFVVQDNVDLTAAGAAVYGVARTGTFVYVPVSGTERKLLWVDRSGVAVPLLDTGDDYWLPRVSPDGSKLAVGMGADVYVIDLERRARSRVTHDTTSALFPFAWSRDSTRILFSHFENKVGLDIYAAPASGSGPGDLVVAGQYRQWATSVSPVSGVVALYEQHPATLRDLWLLQPDGTRTPFLITKYQERAPRFSPTGELIAYVSNESGRDEVYVASVAEPAKRTVVSTEGGVEPVWASDGSEIFFRNGERLLSAAVVSLKPFAVRPPRLIFEGAYERDRGAGGGMPNYDVSRDGRRFVMIQGPGAPPGMIVVLNWFTELDRKLAGK